MKKLLVVFVVILIGLGVYYFFYNNKGQQSVGKQEDYKSYTNTKETPLVSTNPFEVSLGQTVLVNSKLSLRFNKITQEFNCGDDVVAPCGSWYHIVFKDLESGEEEEAKISNTFNVGNFAVTRLLVKDKPEAVNFKLSNPITPETYKYIEGMWSDIQIRSLPNDHTFISPLKVSGKVKESWFKNGSIKLSIQDENGKEISKIVAKEKEANYSYIPFEETLAFQKPSSDKGWFIVSGAEKEFKIPIYFNTLELVDAKI